MSVESVGLTLLRMIEAGQSSLCNSHNVSNPGNWAHDPHGPRGPDFLAAMSEGWAWLEQNRLVAPQPGSGGSNWFIVTRRCKEVAAEPDPLAALRSEARLDVDLHARLGSRIRQMYLSGEFEAAVVMAMREVEIRVRELGNLPVEATGRDLMKQAFGPNGPLTDSTVPKGEQDAAREFFSGSLGLFRNPAAHRQVQYGDATTASEIILLADLLHRLLDEIESRARS